MWQKDKIWVSHGYKGIYQLELDLQREALRCTLVFSDLVDIGPAYKLKFTSFIGHLVVCLVSLYKASTTSGLDLCPPTSPEYIGLYMAG